MSLLSTSRDEVYSTRRALILIFLVAGGIAVWRWNRNEPAFHVLLGLAGLALGIGIWRHWRWARWVALGACFLAIVTGFAMPMLLALWRPFAAYTSEPAMSELFTSIFAAAFGVIGYKGLSYLRSEDARSAFDASGEGSFHVLVSSLCVATLLAGVFTGRDVKLPKASVAVASPAALPDLVVKRLCLSGANRVEAEVANQGAGSRTGVFTIGFSDLQYARYGEYSKGEVPAPGQSTYVLLNNAYNPKRPEGYRLDVRTYLDTATEVPESNEDNNRKDFEIVFDGENPANLPRCPSEGGELRRAEPAATAGSAALPDLVIAGLCMVARNQVKAEVKNVGRGSASGEFHVAYVAEGDHDGGESSISKVPAPGQSNYVEIDIRPQSAARRRLAVYFDIDSSLLIRESNEHNNKSKFVISYHYFEPTDLAECP